MKNTKNVIDWLKEMLKKKVHKFVVFDIKEFYRLVKEQLLKEALAFANSYVNIPENDKKDYQTCKKIIAI